MSEHIDSIELSVQHGQRKPIFEADQVRPNWISEVDLVTGIETLTEYGPDGKSRRVTVTDLNDPEN